MAREPIGAGHAMSPPLSSSYVSIGPMRVRVRIAGHGPPLLLIMGLGGHLDMWQPLTQQLRHRKLVMFDFPGTGGSSQSWFPPTMAHNALFVWLLMGRLKLRRPDILGYSWGGLVAQQLAIQHPHAVRRLILACTSAGVIGVPPNLRSAIPLLTPLRYHSPEYLARIAPGTYGGRFRRDASLIEEEVARRIRHFNPPTLTGYLHQLAAAATYSSIPGLPLVAAETLVVAGNDDPVARPANQHLLHRLLRRSTLEIFPGAGHLLLIDSAEVVAPVIQSFLAAE
jgi:poly(3-hydroxyoctanoate) depolymerase